MALKIRIMITMKPLLQLLLPVLGLAFVPAPHTTSRRLLSTSLHTSAVDAGATAAIDEAHTMLAAYDAAFLKRVREGRAAGRTPFEVEFERAQQLGAAALQDERKQLSSACTQLAAASDVVTLGIMAESGTRGLAVLRQWVPGLHMPKGVLRAVTEDGAEVPLDSYDSAPVYIKYSSKEGGDAYMKPYAGGNRGIIFQPILPDGAFRQYGDLPLATFAHSDGTK